MRACAAACGSSLRAEAQCSRHSYLREEEGMMEIKTFSHKLGGC